MDEKWVVEVKDLVQKVGRQTILNHISFSVARGECLGVFGLQGSGKTSLLHILAGVNRFTAGQVEVLGCNIKKRAEFKKYTGLVTQERSLFQDLNAGENLDFMASLKGVSSLEIDRVAAWLKLQDYLRQPVGKLDAGIYQRLSLACALLGSPQLLIVDELVGNFDVYSVHLVIRVMKQYIAEGGTVIWGFSHIELCDYMTRVAWLSREKFEVLSPREARARWDDLVKSVSKASGDDDV
ncbi:MAG: ATP-binding cassette domain-containing protein [Syntrophomonadaceae bacterium]|jgi:ABC-2 type transport system ATP-binding protein